MKYTCSLCGGKLKDGICTECGMNNQKSDEMYRDCLNRSKYDHASMESMSHVHTEQVPLICRKHCPKKENVYS